MNNQPPVEGRVEGRDWGKFLKKLGRVALWTFVVWTLLRLLDLAWTLRDIP